MMRAKRTAPSTGVDPRAARATNYLLAQLVEEQRAERAYRYATDPVYRAHVDAREAERAEDVRQLRELLARRQRRALRRVGAAVALTGIAAAVLLLVLTV